nr:C4 [Tobacco leaf curl virus]
MKTGLLTCIPFFNSKGNSNAQIRDSSTWYPQIGQHISIATFRELNPAPTSSPTSRRTVNSPTGENSRSMGEVQEVDSNQPMTLTPRQLTLEVSQRLLGSLRN